MSLNIIINRESSETIQQQLFNAIVNGISENDLKIGENLPSINTLCKDLCISRDTVFKVYQELKRRGFVDSTPAKGYFVAQQLNRLLLLLDYFSPFKDAFHQAFIKNIPNSYFVDLVFHHYNRHLFEAIILDSIGRYDMYVVMNFDTNTFEICDELKKIDPSKILFIDIPVKKWNGLNEDKYSYIIQNFDEAVYNCLVEIKDKLKKYKSFNMIFTKKLNHPQISIDYFKKFCKDHNITHKVIYEPNDIIIEKGKAYFVLRQNDLSSILKHCKELNLKPGIDIGILTYNHSPLYEFIGDGITEISTNFANMGFEASEYVKNRQIVKKIIPTEINIKGSL